MELAMKKSCRTHVTKVVNEANDMLNVDIFNVKEAVVHVAKLKSARENLQKANKDAFPFISSDLIDAECSKIVEYDEKIVVAIAQLEQRISEANQSDNLLLGATAGNFMDNVSNNNRLQQDQVLQQPVASDAGGIQAKMSVRLPKLDLIKFSGNYHEWPAFWEQFDGAIHSNNSLDETAKYSYLKSLLFGNAAIAIQGIATGKDNYHNAIDLLVGEYGNKEKIIDSYIQKLLSLSPIKNRSDILSLRTLYNTTTKITKSLQTLGIDSGSYGMMVKSIILKVLPFSMKIEFTKGQANDESERASVSGCSSKSGGELSYESQISRLLSFIKIEVDSVEQAQILSGEKFNDQHNDKPKDKFKHFRRGPRQFNENNECTAAGLFALVREQCLFCKSKEHLTIDCNASIELIQKKNILKSSMRCFRCTKPNHNSRNCRTNINCSKCKRKHATSMCDPDFAKRENSNASNSGLSKERNGQGERNATNLFANSLDNVFLQTACAQIVTTGSHMPQCLVRLVLDGGSQLTFIKECLSRELDLPVIGTYKLSIMPFGKNELTPACVCRRVSVTLKSLNDNDFITISAIEVPEICFDSLPAPTENNPIIQEFSTKYRLADMCPVNNNLVSGISMLIGADFYWTIVTGEIKKMTESQTAVNTRLGWTIHGRNNDYGLSLNVNVANTFYVQTLTESETDSEINDSDFNIKRFWDLESIGIHGVDTVIKDSTNDFIKNNIVFRTDRYSVSLPWKENVVTIDSNINGASSRVKSLTSKLVRLGKLQDYDNAVCEYFRNDCAELAPRAAMNNKIYYMPHRPVYRDDKDTTKIRVVFDASAHALGMPSLNDLLNPIENLVPLMLKVLMNFRIGSVALTADIEKAFLQIEIDETDRDAHSFLWYEFPINDVHNLPNLVKYRMKRVTFGVTSSPFILAATLTKHLMEQPDSLNDVCAQMRRSFYVDDLIMAVDSVDEAQRIYTVGKEVMFKANMNLRKWSTNNVELKGILDKVDEKKRDENKVSAIKILGISWYTETDEMNIDIKPVLNTGQGQVITKRIILRTVAKVFDPLGFCNPYVIRAKLLLQQLWIKKYDWDTAITDELLETWIKWVYYLPELCKFCLPRAIMKRHNSYVELHIFSDASPLAYGAVAYLRVTENDQILSNILMAKNRVAPIDKKGDKTLTLPKLELTGALCAARLQNFILGNLHVEINACVLWTESKITLHWINGKPTKWKPYVCHRVSEIQKLSVGEWRHCPGSDNPADLLSRGIKVKILLESKIWQHGPEWLVQDRNNWPLEEVFPEIGLINVFIVESDIVTYDGKERKPLMDIEKFSDFDKVLRITAYVFRAINKLKNRGKNSTIFQRNMTVQEMIQAENYWIKEAQHQSFKEEVGLLNKKRKIECHSSIIKLNPFLDDNGIMRLGGRLQESVLPYDTKHPILLPKKSIVTDFIILRNHIKTCHGGVNMTITNTRKKYWIIQARQRVKSILKDCLKCKKLRVKPANEPFAPLPRSRLEAVAPFKMVGIDFAGPLFVLDNHEKVYVMIITCAVTRALHLETVPDLTTESCIRALRRFISRRGVPDIVYSDNAKTFKRTALEFSQLSKILCSNEMQTLANQQRIEWRFIIERAAWWGGFWERLVKSVKDALKLTLGRKMINMDELQTTLTEVEATINSRPLTYLHDDPDDLLILTPGHFLLGENLCGFSVNLRHPDIKRDEILKKWKVRNDSLRKFWNRWSTDYLQQLRSAHTNVNVKSKSLKVGDIVLLHDQNLPRLIWKMVKVNKTFMGRGGKVRACEIVTSNGTVLRRPIQLLYPLEITAAGEDVENSDSITQRDCEHGISAKSVE